MGLAEHADEPSRQFLERYRLVEGDPGPAVAAPERRTLDGTKAFEGYDHLLAVGQSSRECDAEGDADPALAKVVHTHTMISAPHPQFGAAVDIEARSG
jgi:hypothetical protein